MERPMNPVIGSKYKIVGSNHSGGVRVGDIVFLYQDDGSTCPFFKKKGNLTSDCVAWASLTPINEDSAPKITNFILQYELDEDPFETFETLKQVEARIKELSKRSDLKKESIKVYEIAKTYDVKLETRVIFGNKITLKEAPKKKRGRPVGSKNKK